MSDRELVGSQEESCRAPTTWELDVPQFARDSRRRNRRDILSVLLPTVILGLATPFAPQAKTGVVVVLVRPTSQLSVPEASETVLTVPCDSERRFKGGKTENPLTAFYICSKLFYGCRRWRLSHETDPS